MVDFAKHAIIDKIVNDFEIGIEVEPKLINKT